MTAPGVVILRTPVECTSETPFGTPVLLASGYPQAEGLGRQVLAPGAAVGRAGGAGVLEACVGFAVGAGRTMCEGPAELLDFGGETELRVGVTPDVALSVAGADEPATDGLDEDALAERAAVDRADAEGGDAAVCLGV